MKFLLNIGLIWVLNSCGNSTAENNSPTAGSTEKETTLSGEQMFKVNCSQCHMPDKDFIAPSMTGVESRWKDKTLLYAFVKNSQEVIQRDQYAKDLFIKWKQTPMLPFPQLSEENIDAIFDYCNEVAAAK